MNTQKIWQKILSDLKISISPAIYKTWFKDLRLKEIVNSNVYIYCPNHYTKEVLEKNNYLEILEDVCITSFEKDLHVLLEVKEEIKQTQVKTPFFNNTYEPSNFLYKEKPLINQKYFFSTFVIGPSNNLAVAAAKAITENPGRVYNPFFIYGGVGLGKTHLICSIGNEILKNDPQKKIFYLSSEKFTNELIIAIQKNQTSVFREKYRQADVLIIDDIQFFAGKEASQEEFFHTFNTLYSENKQIILTSDKPPREINKLEERLVSRFEGGLTVDVQPPDYETRMAILNAKCEEKNIHLNQVVVQYIAENVTENVRKLEGVLSQLTTIALFQRKEVTIEDAQKLLGKRVEKNQKRITPEVITTTVSEFYGITIKDLKGKSRKANFVVPRQTLAYLLRKEVNMPLTQIGEYLGHRDHTTIMYSIEKTENEVKDINSNKYHEIISLKKILFN
ncbi:hypothetical protein A2X44_03450 [candidate division CPR3 bacterium GWF2_35_18]|uniref:Chromosomal replication initiator protein DnaA n=1 Tax=candidate division CPR3 bacterium GW2011_GWF2_35_18 TaxID=1618350 RepID=A0A0G0BJD0_UNCC3|nr:MAG: Chromosomal replication initiator protein DnaA [candidate division CPR3 bacterium GW2011_GWF2_35_18]OGB63035.1 MAG: hypothetical protein A2X44_03450 [candidate division CPR3 bacterium GWF2_35_18]OGB63941.1 MAG: hypothetical protein A2250_02755 [candidate division CPR3 bacterium RIFOXYA2_FULL_35_13]